MSSSFPCGNTFHALMISYGEQPARPDSYSTQGRVRSAGLISINDGTVPADEEHDSLGICRTRNTRRSLLWLYLRIGSRSPGSESRSPKAPEVSHWHPPCFWTILTTSPTFPRFHSRPLTNPASASRRAMTLLVHSRGLLTAWLTEQCFQTQDTVPDSEDLPPSGCPP